MNDYPLSPDSRNSVNRELNFRARGPVPVRRGGARRLAAKLEGLFWLAGAALLGTVGWMLADSFYFQRRAAAELESNWKQSRAPVVAVADTAPRVPAAAVAAGTPLAKLSIPRLGISAVVAEGTDESTLRHALGRIPGSARPGEDGNVALAGHRDTFFRSLGEVKVGERMTLESATGSDIYEVEWAAVVEPTQIAVAQDAGYPALTLVTCYPFHYVGSAPYRYVIRARRTSDHASALPVENLAKG